MKQHLRLWDENGLHTVVVSSSESNPTIRYAAEELAKYLSEMSGYSCPILSVPAPQEDAVNLIVGPTKQFTPDSNLTDDGFQIHTKENRIFIAGNHPRGTLYGVYELLEEIFGCRFFSPEVEIIPKRNSFSIAPVSIRRVPIIEYRSSSMQPLLDPVFAAKRKINGQTKDLDKKFGDRIQYGQGYFVHSFCRHLLKPEDYFDKHPEYYAEIEGKRIREKTQLCLTNPEVQRLVTEKVLEEIRSQPEAKIFSLSQEDNYNGCTCASCRALDEYEGSQAGSLLHFVNAVAEEVEKEFPDVVIDTLAYQYTRRPPKHVHARKNVCVRLCTIECCFVHPLSECTTDDPDAPRKDYAQSFRDDIVAWGKHCDRMYVWDYVTNFSHYWMPHPNLHVLTENIDFFVKNNVRGMFEQGSPTGGEMNDLRAYIVSKAMWDPTCDSKRLRTEFLAAVYGDAAGCIDEYLETVYHAVIACDSHLYCFNHPDKAWHTLELVERCETLFAEAKRLAANETILRRICYQEMAVRYLRILLTPKGSKARNDLIDAFEADAVRYDIQKLWEHEDREFCLTVLRGEKAPGYWWAK